MDDKWLHVSQWCMVPLTAFLIQRLTTRTLYLTAAGLFAVGTVTAGLR